MAELETEKLPLGAGRLIADSFGLVFRNPLRMILAGLPAIALTIVLLLGFGFFAETYGARIGEALIGVVALVWMFTSYGIQIAGYALATRYIEAGEPVRFFRNIGVLLVTLPMNLVLSVTSGTLIMFGLGVFLVPGLWVFAALGVAIPALLIERDGFSSLSRSVRLTKGYRWPVVGVLLLLLIATGLILTAVGFLADLVPMTGLLGQWVEGILVVGLFSGAMSVLGAGTTLIYLRLCEIKEGGGLRDLATVFE